MRDSSNFSTNSRTGPGLVRDLAESLIPHDDDAIEKLVALVDLANQAKAEGESQALLPARYHLFVRAIEGAYLSLAGDKRLYLERHESITKRREKIPCFRSSDLPAVRFHVFGRKDRVR